MKLKVHGVQHYDFNNSKGEHVSGYKLHTLNENISNDAFTGCKCEVVSCKDEAYHKLLANTADGKLVGKDIEVEYNSYGKVESLRISK